ncbi:MAG: radical SAM protein [Candidatus Omnitrophica bacterium]|jgi:MoaA/NifB/PqqE/SkfB family radical SAM enzyme|nr:radical SAM protein [Candidatus Omnitrophota bacterium]
MKNQLPPPKLTKRIDINTGYSCNLKCSFCYYLNDVKSKNKNKDLSTLRCKNLISYYAAKKMQVLEFTGGEPTIRKDFLELVSFARDKGFKKISLITNGILLSDRSFARRLVENKVEDFLFSLHGSTSDVHDKVTGMPGSYKLLNKAIENLLGLSVKVRCNSVVNGENFSDVYQRAKLFKDLGVKIVNFILFNPIEQAKFSDKKNFICYADVSDKLKRIADDFGPFFNKLTFRYIPFCQMAGYEKHVQNVHQVHYDHDEWNYYLRSFIRENRLKWVGAVGLGMMLLPEKEKWLSWGMEHFKSAAILQAHSFLHKHKFPQCKRCRYGFICGGIWKNYASYYGDRGIKESSGELILQPWHFMGQEQLAHT